MNILLLGSGGREHAMAWKIAQSNKLTKLYIAPGNAGTATVGENVAIAADNFDELAAFAVNKSIDMLIVGPEDPLVKGVHDYFLAHDHVKHIPVIGPTKAGAMLEGSKEFAKSFMHRHNIPTAKYYTVTNENLPQGFSFLEKMQAPYVLKADGLAAGKGVLIINSLDEAKTELKQMLNGKFGEASNKVVIEECLKGIELSVFVLTDGKNYKILPEAKDYKRIGEGDTGLNTGGMGAVSPVPFAQGDFLKKVEEQVVKPTINGFIKDNIPYKGFVFIGLMNDNGQPYVIEYNVRMGDPESEAVFPRLNCDMVEVFDAVAKQKLNETDLPIKPESCTTVMLVSGGYPGTYLKDKVITGLDNVTDVMLFHAGTKVQGTQVKTAGGRVIAISALGNTFAEALNTCYKNTSTIDFEGKYFRKDIGFDL